MFIKSPMNKQIFVGIYTVAMFHVGAKSALLRRLFMPMAKKTSSARSLAPPFKNESTSLGFNFVLLAFISANTIRASGPLKPLRALRPQGSSVVLGGVVSLKFSLTARICFQQMFFSAAPARAQICNSVCNIREQRWTHSSHTSLRSASLAPS